MTGFSPFVVVEQVVAMLDRLGIPYALGGSLAASVFGEPRSTADVDVAIAVDGELGEGLLSAAAAEFYVPADLARVALATGGSFNLIPRSSPIKVDLFALGDGLLDRRQIERRVLVRLPSVEEPVWVTSAEDIILRKLEWFRLGGGVSDRQWRDILGVIRVVADRLDRADLSSAAVEVGLDGLLQAAFSEA